MLNTIKESEGKNSRCLGRRHGKKEWNWNGKDHKDDFRVTGNVLFPNLGSRKTGVHVIIFHYNLHICENIVWYIFNI